jgi:hypothetical protein
MRSARACSARASVRLAWPRPGRSVARFACKKRLSEARRSVLCSIFDQVRDIRDVQAVITPARMLTYLAETPASKPPVFEHVLIDEAQDVSVAQLRFLAALRAGRPNGRYFAGELGLRSFQQRFSWLGLGVDIRGRSKILRVNYRTSHQIRMRADRLLGPEVREVACSRARAHLVVAGVEPASEVLADLKPHGSGGRHG